MLSDPKRASALVEEIELLSEAFYYFAFRAQRVIASLPGLKGFEAAGVGEVRNHLIEHPDKKDSLVLGRSFVFGAERGPVLHGWRFAHEPQAWQDAGLYANAEEFSDQLQALLRPYLARDREERESVP